MNIHIVQFDPILRKFKENEVNLKKMQSLLTESFYVYKLQWKTWNLQYDNFLETIFTKYNIMYEHSWVSDQMIKVVAICMA